MGEFVTQYGMDAILILNEQADEDLVTTDLKRLLTTLEPVADRLNCLSELDGINRIIEVGASYQRQWAVAAENPGFLEAVVESLVAEMKAGHPLPRGPVATR